MHNNDTERFRSAYWEIVHNLDLLRLRVWEERGITLPQLRILFILRAQPGMTTNALASQLGLSAATVSGLIEKLVKAGLVERRQDPEDRRLIPLHLTDAGWEIVGEISQGNRSYLGALAEDLGDDLSTVIASMERIVAILRARPALMLAARDEVNR